jgi:hypothetical protein
MKQVSYEPAKHQKKNIMSQNIYKKFGKRKTILIIATLMTIL